MSKRIARIYKSPIEGADVIGFSRSACDAMEDPRLREFLNERGYASIFMPMRSKSNRNGVVWYWDEPDRLPEDGTSYGYVEVSPPLTEEHIQEFGKLCVGSVGQSGIIDPYHDGTVVYDNREYCSGVEMGPGRLIATG